MTKEIKYMKSKTIDFFQINDWKLKKETRYTMVFVNGENKIEVNIKLNSQSIK